MLAEPLRPHKRPGPPAINVPSPLVAQMDNLVQQARSTIDKLPPGQPPLIPSTSVMNKGTPPGKNDPSPMMVASELMSSASEERMDTDGVTPPLTTTFDYTASPCPSHQTLTFAVGFGAIQPTYGPTSVSVQYGYTYSDPYAFSQYSPDMPLATPHWHHQRRFPRQ